MVFEFTSGGPGCFDVELTVKKSERHGEQLEW